MAQSQYELESLWVNGALPSVDLRFGDEVRASAGEHVGKSGRVVALLSIDPVPLYVIEEVAGTSFNAIRFFTGWSVSGRDKLGEQISGTFYTLGRKHVRFYFIVSDQWPVSTMHYE